MSSKKSISRRFSLLTPNQNPAEMESTGKPEDKPDGRHKFIPAEAELPVDLQMDQLESNSSTDQLVCVPVKLTNLGEKSCIWMMKVSDKCLTATPDSGILRAKGTVRLSPLQLHKSS